LNQVNRLLYGFLRFNGKIIKVHSKIFSSFNSMSIDKKSLVQDSI